MILIPKMKYARITNPVCLKLDGTPEQTSFGQVKVKLNDTQIRTSEEYPDWFPLYPGEVLSGIFDAHVIRKNETLRVKVIDEYVENEKTVAVLSPVLP